MESLPDSNRRSSIAIASQPANYKTIIIGFFAANSMVQRDLPRHAATGIPHDRLLERVSPRKRLKVNGRTLSSDARWFCYRQTNHPSEFARHEPSRLGASGGRLSAINFFSLPCLRKTAGQDLPHRPSVQSPRFHRVSTRTVNVRSSILQIV